MCFQYTIKYVIISYNFQYTTKLRHNVVYVVNLGNYRTDMTISSTALDQPKLLNHFNNKYDYPTSKVEDVLDWAGGLCKRIYGKYIA